jgi:hypothetical protein
VVATRRAWTLTALPQALLGFTLKVRSAAAAMTVTFVVSATPPAEAMIWALPAARPVTSPSLTVATVWLVLSHRRRGLLMTTPEGSRTLAVSRSVSPTATKAWS